MAYTEQLTDQDLVQMYRWMVLTRTMEDYLCGAWGKSSLLELPHGSQGQEAIAVGTCYNLRREDQVLPSLRTRGAFLVKGISARFSQATRAISRKWRGLVWPRQRLGRSSWSPSSWVLWLPGTNPGP